MISQLTASGPTLLPQHACFKSGKSRASKSRSGRHVQVVAALPDSFSAWKDTVANAGKAGLLAAVLTTGMSVAPLDPQLLQPARADEEAGLSASERRSNANERRRAILTKARENALRRGELAEAEGAPAGDTTIRAEPTSDTPQSSGTSFFNVQPEQPQLKTEIAKPELPIIPKEEVPKSKLPDKPKFTMPSKPPQQAPPPPSLTVPRDLPKTESPVQPVPPAQAPAPTMAPIPAPQTAAAPPPTPKPAPAPAATQGFNFDDILKSKEEAKPKTSSFFGGAVDPEKKQASISQETKDRLAAQARNQGKQVDKRASKRHGPPLFLVQLLLTVGLGAGLFFAVTKYDSMMAGSLALEKKVIELLEKVQLPK